VEKRDPPREELIRKLNFLEDGWQVFAGWWTGGGQGIEAWAVHCQRKEEQGKLDWRYFVSDYTNINV
jgi:hypothetical protein